jgi:protein subunit release factor B
MWEKWKGRRSQFDSMEPDKFPYRKDPVMALPTQIDERLAAVGARADEVEERFVRGSGPGGQKINKTSSTVWLRHRPTGLEVRCQRERSQTANRDLAWAELIGKLEARVRAATAAVVAARETERRRTRQKSYGQKVRMIHAKQHRAGHKAKRGRVSGDGW